MNTRESRNITTTIIVPVLNEEDGLPVVLDKLFRLRSNGYEIIVVDDGSTDRTADIARQFPCKLIKHEYNRGKGEALKSGIENARGSNVIWIDGDDTYPVDTIPQIADALKNYDLVVCSRVHGKENIPRFNRLGNWAFRTLIRKIYGFGPQDPCSGLCGARKYQLERMELSSKRFAIEPEISIKGSRMKLRMLDIPSEYQPRIGNAKLNAVKAGFEDLKIILRLLFWQKNPERHRSGKVLDIGAQPVSTLTVER